MKWKNDLLLRGDWTTRFGYAERSRTIRMHSQMINICSVVQLNYEWMQYDMEWNGSDFVHCISEKMHWVKYHCISMFHQCSCRYLAICCDNLHNPNLFKLNFSPSFFSLFSFIFHLHFSLDGDGHFFHFPCWCWVLIESAFTLWIPMSETQPFATSLAALSLSMFLDTLLYFN